MSVLIKMALAAPDRARRSRCMGVKREREFLFHRFNPSTRTCTNTRVRDGGRVRAYLQRARALFISRILALLQIRKKEGEYIPSPASLFRTLAHHIKLLQPPYHLFILRSRAPLVRFRPAATAAAPTERECAREKNSSSLGGRENWSSTNQHPEQRR